MPGNSRRRRLPNPHKTQLTFVETPINGDIHRYGPQPRSAINPRSLFCGEPNRNSKTWVSPQFDQLPNVLQKRRRRWYSQSVSSTKCNSTSSNIRKNSTCKYPTLSFGTSAAEGHCTNKGLRREAKLITHQKKQTSYRAGPSNVQAKVDLLTPRQTYSLRRRSTEGTLSTDRTHGGSAENESAASPSDPHMSRGMRNSIVSPKTCTSMRSSSPDVGTDMIPPDIDTPEMSKVTSSSKCTLLHLLLPSTPPHSHNSDVLVEDTPERDYGLKVTWRKRKGLMRLLMKRGQLTSQQAEVIAC